MGLFTAIQALFDPAVVIVMRVSAGGIRLSFQINGKNVAYSALRQVSQLPTVVDRALRGIDFRPDSTYLLPFETAYGLATELSKQVSRYYKLDADLLLQLTSRPAPPDFAIHWRLSSAYWTLVREIQGADQALGQGWFLRGTSVWQLDRAVIPEDLRDLFNRSVLGGNDAVDLLTKLMPFARQHQLALTTDAVLGSPEILRIEVIKMLDRSLDLRLVASDSSLLSTLRALPDAAEHVVSASMLFPNLGKLLGKALTPLSKGTIARLTGDAVPRFIKAVQELTDPADLWGLDRATLLQRYPLTELQNFKPHWELQHGTRRGVGYYEASALLSSGRDRLSTDSVRTKVANGEQFVRTNTGWIALDSSAKTAFQRTDSGLERDFVLSPSEVLAGGSQRFVHAQLSTPDIAPALISDDGNAIYAALNALRGQGLPAVLSGYADFGTALLIEVCQALLQDYPAAQILWVSSTERQKELRAALTRHNLIVRAANRTRQLTETGAVYVCDSFYSGLNAARWTTIIFESSAPALFSAAGVWTQTTRDWSVFTAAPLFSTLSADRKRIVLDLLGLTSVGLERVMRHCALQPATPERPTSIIDKAGTAFKQIVIGGEADNTGVPIPKRSDSTSDTQAFRPQFRPGSPADPAVASTGNTKKQPPFIALARRYVDRTETHAEFIPFMQYWPSYAAMTPDQQRWYFYWRTHARNGSWLPTDLSYLFVYVYEALNLIGFATPRTACKTLIRVWTAYRKQYPTLDRSLVDWIADFSVIFSADLSTDPDMATDPTPTTPLAWYAYALANGGSLGDPGLAYAVWQAQSASADTTRRYIAPLLFALTDYKPEASKFYQQANAAGSVDSSLMRAIAAVDSYVQRSQKTALLDQPLKAGSDSTSTSTNTSVSTSASAEIRRAPFSSAIHAYPDTPILIATLHADPDALTILGDQLKNIFKYTENILRVQAGFKGKLRGIEIPQAWSKVIDQAMATPKAVAAAPVIALDRARIEQLNAESRVVRAMLTVADDQPKQTTGKAAVNPAPPPSIPEQDAELQIDAGVQAAAQDASSTLAPVRPADSPDGRLTELVAVSRILGIEPHGHAQRVPHGPVRILFKTLQSANWRASASMLQSALQAELSGIFASTVIDQANERALNAIGDQVLFEEGSEWVVADDFRDELAYLLDHAYVPESASVPDYVALDAGWRDFARKLQPVHWRIVNGLFTQTGLTQTEVESLLRTEAQTAHTMPLILIETINEWALETTGDLIIDATPEPPVILADAHDSVQQLLAWAMSQPALLN